MSEEKIKDVKIKHTARNCIIIILLLVIVCMASCSILYANKMLPDSLQNQISKMLGKEEKEEPKKEKNKDQEEVIEEKKPIYEVIAELDSKYDDSDVEIVDVANVNTMLFGKFTKSEITDISIISVDGKCGLISNQDDEILVEPKYDRINSEFDNTCLYGWKKDGTVDKIDVKNFKIVENVEVGGHGGGSDEFYDPEKDEIWSQEYEDVTTYTPNGTLTERYKEIDSIYGIAYELKQGEYAEDTQKLRICYYDVVTGKIAIKPEYDKGTLFYNGVAGVVKKNKAYFINKDNEKIYDVEFEDCANIHNGVAWVKEDGTWKLIEFDEEQRIDIEKEDIEEDKEESDADDSWKGIYKKYILDGNLEDYGIVTANSRAATMSFVDIDSDGTPELMHFDGMEPGPHGNTIYEVYGIKNGKVIDIGQVGCGQFTKVGYNKEKNSYGYETEQYGISADQGAIVVATEKGLEDRVFTVGEDSKISLEDNGYKMKKIDLEEFRCDSELDKKALEKNFEMAVNAYVPTSQLVK